MGMIFLRSVSDACSQFHFANGSREHHLHFSEEDLDIQQRISQFTKVEADNLPASLPEWMELVTTALRWLKGKTNTELSTSRLGIVENALSHIRFCRSKNEFLVGIMRGFAPYVAPSARQEFAEQVCGPPSETMYVAPATIAAATLATVVARRTLLDVV